MWFKNVRQVSANLAVIWHLIDHLDDQRSGRHQDAEWLITRGQTVKSTSFNRSVCEHAHVPAGRNDDVALFLWVPTARKDRRRKHPRPLNTHTKTLATILKLFNPTTHTPCRTSWQLIKVWSSSSTLPPPPPPSLFFFPSVNFCSFLHFPLFYFFHPSWFRSLNLKCFFSSFLSCCAQSFAIFNSSLPRCPAPFFPPLSPKFLLSSFLVFPTSLPSFSSFL